MRIQNNIMAMNTHRQYGINNTNIAKSLEKLSSGYRVNRAGDDAAGLAISEKMRAQIRGLTMASKNSQDAISLVQTAEGALQSTHDILQRMRELAVQSSSDTNEQIIDRGALQQEFKALLEEIDEIASKTRFNDQNLIDGTFQKVNMMINGTSSAGGWTGITVDRAIGGTYAFTASAVAAVAASSGSGTPPGTIGGTILATITGIAAGVNDLTDTVAAVTAAANAQNNGMTYTIEMDGAKASAMTVIIKDSAGNEVSKLQNVDMTTAAFSSNVLKLSFAGVGEITFTKDAASAITDDAAGVSTWKGAYFGKTITFSDDGVDAVANPAKPAAIDLKLGSETVRVYVNDTEATFKEAGVSIRFTKLNDLELATPTLKFAPGDLKIDALVGKSLIIQVGANQGDEIGINIDKMNTGKLGISFSRIDSQANAARAITEVNDALNQVSTQRAALGALQNKLEFKIANLDTSAENLQAAESRIRDLDMAKEMTNFTKSNILAQAATAMLAQANALPQGVLQLLK